MADITGCFRAAPKAFRDWFEGGVEGLQQHGEKDVDPPMDRFAARGDHHTPTRMPSTDAQRELEEARRVRHPPSRARAICNKLDPSRR